MGAPARAQLMFSQYYEGASFNKLYEITNMGDTTVTATYFVCLYSNPSGDPVGITPTNIIALPTNIAPCQILTYKNNDAALPTYAISSATTTATTNYNGNDILIISTTSDNTAWANRTDVLGSASNWGADISLVRTTTAPSTAFNTADWLSVSNSTVDNASPGTDIYLGFHTCSTSVTPTFNLSTTSYSMLENGGGFTFQVIVTSPANCTVELAQTAGTATNGTDYSFSPNTFTFTSGGVTSQTVTVNILDDFIDEPNETFTLSLQSVGGTGGCAIGTANELAVAILDNDGSVPQIKIDSCESGLSLRTFLTNNYKTGATLGYDVARDTLYKIIDAVNGQLSGIYSGYTITLDPNVDPTTDAQNKGINLEHSFPQSMGADVEPQRSDMHAMFPSKENVNSDRSNCPYGEIPDNVTGYWYRDATVMTTIPTTNIDEYSEKDLPGFSCGHFEPRESVKGDIARAIFYFYTMYTGPADDNFFNGMKDILYAWHYQDPVDSKEYNRTWAIAAYQQNKPNPFVLDSTLVRRAYFEPSATAITPGSVSLIAPLDAATAVAPAPTLSWNAATDATSYDIQLATDAAFANIVIDQNTAASSYSVSPNLSYLTAYYWRVRGKNYCSTGAWSSVYSFTTQSNSATQCLIDVDFEGGQPSGWLFTNTWTFDSGYIGNVNTAGANFGTGVWAQFDDNAFGSGVANAASATMPAVDIANFSDVNLSFNYTFRTYTANSTTDTLRMRLWDGLQWQYWNGNAWVTSNAVWLSSVNQRAAFSEAIPSAFCNSSFKVEFLYGDGGGWEMGFGFDDFLLCGTPPIGCPDTLIVSNQTVSDNLQAASLVISTATVASGLTVLFEAGDSIVLQPGFHAQAGSDFTARIAACTALQAPMPQAKMVQSFVPQALPNDLALKIMPNPTKGTTKIRYFMPHAEQAIIGLYDINGRCVMNLPQGIQQEGLLETTLDVSSLPKGLYVLRILSSSSQQTGKLVVE